MIDLKNKKLLVIAPHPDDEAIGCAGLIQKVKSSGGRVYILFLTVGDTADFTKKGLSTGSERKKEIEKVAAHLGYDDYDILFAGNEFHLRLDTLGQKALMDKIERESPLSIEKIKPDIIAFPSFTSYNQDHKIAARATHAALRPANPESKHLVPVVLSYEEVADDWSLEPHLSPNFFVPLTDIMIEEKIKAVKLYSSQYRKHPSTRSAESIKALAILRGAESGNEYSEGFFALRVIS